MIKIDNIETFGWKAAIRGMRNPMNSWSKSDSKRKYVFNYKDNQVYYLSDVEIGKMDLGLMKKLVVAGTDHSKFMRMIHVQMDITAPLYWWKEFDTYKVGTVVNSCSTMHKIHDKEFTLDDFSHECLSDFSSHPEKVQDPLTILLSTIKTLNSCRECYIKENDKFFWWQMIQLLPSSYNQLRTVDLNYEVIHNMYFARRNHKLDEWREFCDTMSNELPYFAEIIGVENEDE